MVLSSRIASYCFRFSVLMSFGLYESVVDQVPSLSPMALIVAAWSAIEACTKPFDGVSLSTA